MTSSEQPQGRPDLSIVVPCYNEEQALKASCARLLAVLDRAESEGLATGGQIYFVDDGSQDRTWAVIEGLAAGDDRVHGIKLSRNFGQQSALLAGLFQAPGNALVSIDADLQDDENAIMEMLCAYAGGAEIVYGIRHSRRTDSFFKRFTAEGYYRLLRRAGVDLVFNHADFRLLSRRVIEQLRGYQERNLLLRGLIPQLGFNTSSVYYDRAARTAGETKYNLARMISLAVSGVTSFTELPLKAITVLGLIVSAGSFGMSLWALGTKIFNPAAVPGWASTVIPLYFLGGIQLLCLGVIGQYVAKIHSEAKARPRYIVEKSI